MESLTDLRLLSLLSHIDWRFHEIQPGVRGLVDIWKYIIFYHSVGAETFLLLYILCHT